jgi:PPOX class probable F420-dependent enzyme
MSNTTGIASNKYVSLTTFTKDGTPKPLAVWIVELSDGRVGFTTSIDSWKVKRIMNTAQVTLRPSDQRGRVAHDAVEVTGMATVAEGDEFVEVKALVKAKYGMWVTLIATTNAVRGVFSKAKTHSDTAVVITLD